MFIFSGFIWMVQKQSEPFPNRKGTHIRTCNEWDRNRMENEIERTKKSETERIIKQATQQATCVWLSNDPPSFVTKYTIHTHTLY